MDAVSRNTGTSGQKEYVKLRKQAHQDNTTGSWISFRAVRNELKQHINKTKKSFMTKALSSKRSKEVWRVVHRILHPSPQPIRACPNELNCHFANTAQRTLEVQPDKNDQLLSLLESLPDIDDSSFALKKVTPNEVIKLIKELRSDCSRC